MTRAFPVWFRRLFVVSFACAALSHAASDAPAKGEWRQYSGDNGSTKYSPLDQINRSNVMKLSVAWRHPQIDAEFLAANPKLRFSNNYRSTPIIAKAVLYATNAILQASLATKPIRNRHLEAGERSFARSTRRQERRSGKPTLMPG